MAHPFSDQSKTGRQRAHARYADGGEIDEGIDISREGEGPYNLNQAMQGEKAVMDRREVDSGKRFYDTGTRIPGRQKAKNDDYESRLKGR